MRDKRPLVIGIAAAVLIGVLCGAFALGVFRSDAERATDAVTELMESYVVPVADEDGKEPEDAAWPAADYGDAATMEALQKYGVNADEWHRHCFGHFSYQMGEASVEDGSGTVSVTVTNTSLAAALEDAGADFSSFSSTQEAEDAYAQGGKAGLFTNLVQRVYDRQRVPGHHHDWRPLREGGRRQLGAAGQRQRDVLLGPVRRLQRDRGPRAGPCRGRCRRGGRARSLGRVRLRSAFTAHWISPGA